jgi:hypothetical protein
MSSAQYAASRVRFGADSKPPQGPGNVPPSSPPPGDKPPESSLEALKKLLDTVSQSTQGQLDQWDPQQTVDTVKKGLEACVGEKVSDPVKKTLQGDPTFVRTQLTAGQKAVLAFLDSVAEKAGPEAKGAIENSKASVVTPAFKQMEAWANLLPGLPMVVRTILNKTGETLESATKTAANTVPDPAAKKLLETLGQKGKGLTSAVRDAATGKNITILDILTDPNIAQQLAKDIEAFTKPGAKGSKELEAMAKKLMEGLQGSDLSGLEGLMDALKPPAQPPVAPKAPQPQKPAPTPALSAKAVQLMEMGAPVPLMLDALIESQYNPNDSFMDPLMSMLNASREEVFEAMLEVTGIKQLEAQGISRALAGLKLSADSPEKASALLGEAGFNLETPEMALVAERYGLTPEETLNTLKEAVQFDARVAQEESPALAKLKIIGITPSEAQTMPQNVGFNLPMLANHLQEEPEAITAALSQLGES